MQPAMQAAMQFTLFAIAVLSALPALAALRAPSATEPARGPASLVFEEEFNSLDLGRWQHQVSAWRGGNDEFQYYRNDRRNSYVKDGILYLLPTLTADELGEEFLSSGTLSYPDCNREPCASRGGGPHGEIALPVQSARVSTADSFAFRFGRIDVRARLPRGDWLWPAIWLLPAKGEEFSDWPRGGELDVMESRGNANLTDTQGRRVGLRAMSSAVHFGPAWDQHRYDVFEKVVDSDTLADDFHVYSLDWSEAGLRFLLDNETIGELPAPAGGFWRKGGFQGSDIWQGRPMAPFDQKFYIILNLAVGGRFFDGDYLHNGPYPRPFHFSSGQAMRQFWEQRHQWQPTWRGEDAALRVDYVRVHQHV